MDLDRLNRVLAYIEEHLEERVGVRNLAATAQMSPFHFSRKFKEATGLPPHAHVTRLRMERARFYLAHTGAPMSAIARRIGYQTQAHFTCAFRQNEGTTPRAWRAANAVAASAHAGRRGLPDRAGRSLASELGVLARHREADAQAG
jgi:AraC family transcriptional regulator